EAGAFSEDVTTLGNVAVEVRAVGGAQVGERYLPSHAHRDRHAPHRLHPGRSNHHRSAPAQPTIGRRHQIGKGAGADPRDVERAVAVHGGARRVDVLQPGVDNWAELPCGALVATDRDAQRATEGRREIEDPVRTRYAWPRRVSLRAARRRRGIGKAADELEGGTTVERLVAPQAASNDVGGVGAVVDHALAPNRSLANGDPAAG